MKDHKASTTRPTAIMEFIHSHSARAMTEYYSKAMIGGCSNRDWSHEDTNKELANCLPAKNCTQTELP